MADTAAQRSWAERKRDWGQQQATRTISLNYTPTPKQALMHNSTARQILYGGSAGAGKSRALRWDAVLWCLAIPGIECFLFRRTYPELYDNHIRPLQRELPIEVAEYMAGRNLFRFCNGSKIVMGHCAERDDHLQYQGAEIHVLLIDEAALFLPHHIIELRGRLRLGSFSEKVPEEYKKYLPRVVMASNPGGPSHELIKSTFIEPAKPGTVFFDTTLRNPSKPEDPGWTTIFIPAWMSDNPHIDQDYGSAMAAMSPERREALLSGDWDTVEGAALHSLSRVRHCVKSFPIPMHWTKFMAMDWGTASPFAVIWFAVAGEETIVLNNPHLDADDKNPARAVRIPAGALVAYDELYGWTGKPNEGLRLDSVAVAKMILDKETEDKVNFSPISYRIGDAAMFAQFDGPSPGERMMMSTNGKIVLGKSKKDRAAQYNEFLCRLAGNAFLQEDGKTNDPMLFISDKCRQAWRTLPPLLLDDLYPDKGPGDHQEDHAYDSCCYGLTSRPMTISKQQSDHRDYLAARQVVKDARAGDAYSTR